MVVPEYIRKALSAQALDTDFTPYFAFIESIPQVAKGHRHHILPKKEFPEFAKDPNNLIRVSPSDHFRAHYWLAVCAPNYEPFQRVFFFMTNFKRYASQIKSELPKYAEIYEKGRRAQAVLAEEFGRIYGPINGERNVKNGQMARLGRIQGRKNVEGGWLDEIRTHETCVEGGLAAGKKATTSGQIQVLARSGVGGRKGGVTQGRKNVENGWFASVKTFETCSKGGRIANHNRWHVDRNLVNPTCSFCGVI